jgi:hypothetical protein
MSLQNSSPMKSLSVRQNQDGKRSLHVKRGDNSYKSISNFHFLISCFVEFPKEFQRYNGYLVDVQRMDGVQM